MAVFFYGCVSLDGYLATSDHGLDWLYETGTTEETSYDEFYRCMDVTVMGRRTFEEIRRLGNPGEAYPSTENFVFTHREFDCPGFSAVEGSPVDFVRALGSDRNIWVVGGTGILAPLLDEDMVDHLVIQIAPVLLGSGISLFTQAAVRRFRLERVNQYDQFAELVCSK